MELTQEHIEARIEELTVDRDRINVDLADMQTEATRLVGLRDNYNGAIQALADLLEPKEEPEAEAATGEPTTDENGMPCVYAGAPTSEDEE